MDATIVVAVSGPLICNHKAEMVFVDSLASGVTWSLSDTRMQQPPPTRCFLFA